MKRCCPGPAPAPLEMYPNCPVTFIRSCADGTGVVIESIEGGYLFSPDSVEAATALAEEIARLRALQTVLYCNTLVPSDLADCGLLEERPSFNPACALIYCNGSGISYCDEDGVNYTSKST